MLEEWGHMTKGAALELICPNLQEQSKIRKFFVEHFEPITEMYKHAAAVGSDAGTGTISFMEFSSFLKESKVIEGSNLNDDIQRIFIESHVNDEETQGTVTLQSELHQHEFFVSMIAVAVFLKIRMKRGGRSSIAKARGARGKVITPSEAVRQIYDDKFVPYIGKYLIGPSIKAALGTDEVLLLFKQHDEKLRTIFRIYGDRFGSKIMKGDSSGAMNIHEFGNLISDSELMKKTSKNSNDELTTKEIRQAFSAAQHDAIADEHEAAAVAEGTRSSHLTQMTYCEFLEAIARIGASKWEGEIKGDLHEEDSKMEEDGRPRLRPMGLFVKIEKAILAILSVLEIDKNAKAL